MIIAMSIGFITRDAMKRLKKALGRIACPVLIVQGSKDKVVSNDSPRRLYEGLASEKKDIWIVEGANHPMMNQKRHKDKLFARTIAFSLSVSLLLSDWLLLVYCGGHFPLIRRSSLETLLFLSIGWTS